MLLEHGVGSYDMRDSEWERDMGGRSAEGRTVAFVNK